MRNSIEEILREHQIGTFGYGNVSDFLPEKYDDLTTAVSFAVRMSDAIIDGIQEGPTHEYFHLYRTANRYIDEAAFKVALALQSRGYRAVPVAASQSINLKGSGGYQGLFSHRLAASRAGLGWIGKNNSLVTFDYGPRVRLGTVLTNWETEWAQPVDKSFCGECTLCVEKCPALALSGETWTKGLEREAIVDVVSCSNHMKTFYKDIGRGVVCGICVAACPVGKER